MRICITINEKDKKTLTEMALMLGVSEAAVIRICLHEFATKSNYQALHNHYVKKYKRK